MSETPTLPRLTVADMIAAVGDRPYALVNLARSLLADQGDHRGAIELYRQALALAPTDPKLRAICNEFMSRTVGGWYFTMVQDHARHELYENAFRRAIEPGDRVLDIGAGTGLFAMMAARAGAGEVIACERDPVVADTARAIVEANGLSHVVQIVEADSKNLRLGEELAEQADVLVWDNLANNLVGAGGLDTLEDAKARLLKPGAVLIPYAAEIRVGLARTTGMAGMGTVAGFDLSAFDSLRRTHTKGLKRVEPRSDAASLFAYDFRSDLIPKTGEGVSIVTQTDGEVNAIVQWLTFHLHEDISYDTSKADVMAFGIEAHPIEPFEAVAGAPARIAGSHDRSRLWLWLQEP